MFYESDNSMIIDYILVTLMNLEERVARTEKKSFTSRAQQMLILKHLGLLNSVNNLKINQKQKGKLLGALLNSSAENIEKDLAVIENARETLVKTEKNYEFLANLFKECNLSTHLEEVENQLRKIRRRKKK